MKKIFESKKLLMITTLSLLCLFFIGCKSLNAKVFENDGRFIRLRDNIPVNSILLQSGELFDAGWIVWGKGNILPAQTYNLKTHKISKINNSMSPPRINYSKVLLADGRVLILGGNICHGRGIQGNATNFAEIFDPVTKTFSKISNMNYARAFGTQCVLLQDGRVFIISPNLPVEIFDPATEKFMTVGNVRQYTIKSPDKSITQTLTVKFSTINEFFSVIPVLLKDGRVLLVGNSFESGNAELFDPKTNLFAIIGQMNSPRMQFTATLLKDGRVLVAGGRKNIGGYGIASAELFDPITNVFNETGKLNIKRYNHSAILLSNGKVLIVDGNYGHSEDLKDLKNVEIFNPETGTFKKVGLTHKAKINAKLLSISKNQVLIPYGSETEIYNY